MNNSIAKHKMFRTSQSQGAKKINSLCRLVIILAYLFHSGFPIIFGFARKGKEKQNNVLKGGGGLEANHVFWIPVLKTRIVFGPKTQVLYMLLHVLV